ncbi:hypothetical protein ACLB2K_004504 [Fragaria x ananassa]
MKGQNVNLQAKAGEKRSRRGLVSRGVRYTRVGCPVEFAVRYCSKKRMYRDLYNKMDKLRKKSHTDGDAQAAMTWMNMRGIDSELFCCRCNNHKATVVFGFALIRDERKDTYEWVFQNFLESMEDLQHGAILTDGDEVVRNIVECLMPAARHRLCAWHIRRNIRQNVKDHTA